MKHWKISAMTLALVGAAWAGAALAPRAEGQSRGVGEAVRIVQALGGGSQIGVSVRDVDETTAIAKLSAPGGVVIEDVRDGSPAEKAGLRKGDIVVEFDGERVRSVRQFARLVQETPADRQVTAAVVRDGQRTTLTVQPQASDGFNIWRHRDDFGGRLHVRPPRPPAPPAPPTPPTPPTPPMPYHEMFPRLEGFFDFTPGRLGISVERLSEQLAEYFGTSKGVLVASVHENSAAAKAGLKAGDVITAIDGTEVTSPGDLTRRVQRLDDEAEFTLDIVRDKKRMTLKGKLERHEPRRWTAGAIV